MSPGQREALRRQALYFPGEYEQAADEAVARVTTKVDELTMLFVGQAYEAKQCITALEELKLLLTTHPEEQIVAELEGR